MNCDKAKEYLYQYIDGELENEICRDVQTHLSQCPLCALHVEQERKTDCLIRNHVPCQEAPFELRETVINRIEQSHRFSFGKILKPVRSFVPQISLGTLGIVIFALVLTNNNPSFPIFSESIKEHVEYLKGGYPLEIKTNDINEALAWFRGKVDFAIERPHLDPKKVNLVGARIVHLKDRKAAYFIYEKDGHQISAFYMDIKPSQVSTQNAAKVVDSTNSIVYVSNARGYQSVVCLHKNSGTGCVLVSDLPKERLLSLMG
jgi:mycothiol system anti-sigma-R factor